MKARVASTSSMMFLLALALAAGVGPGRAQAQTQGGDSLTTEAARMDRMAGTLGEVKVTDKLSAEFNSFLGADARAVVTGLRSGTPIALTRTAPGSTPGSAPVTTTTTTITPPTGKMGFGNVFISLALAKQELSQLGIAQPTPQQLQAALTGGTITSGTGTTATSTNLQGVLTLMGWGQIAQKLGFKLGSVVSGLKSANHGLATGAASASEGGIVSSSGQPVGSSEGGLVTGSGRSVGRSGQGAAGRSEGGDGIVTGSGRSVGGAESGITTGRGHAYGVSGSSSSSAGGTGRGKGSGKSTGD
ncbi:MAG: hypothetical protein HYY83_06180 [Deltaproteobacteria bacterium]|nr:hypothetical protein [Deltaproteobacteria bacterium]